MYPTQGVHGSPPSLRSCAKILSQPSLTVNENPAQNMGRTKTWAAFSQIQVSVDYCEISGIVPGGDDLPLRFGARGQVESTTDAAFDAPLTCQTGYALVAALVADVPDTYSETGLRNSPPPKVHRIHTGLQIRRRADLSEGMERKLSRGTRLAGRSTSQPAEPAWVNKVVPRTAGYRDRGCGRPSEVNWTIFNPPSEASSIASGSG